MSFCKVSNRKEHEFILFYFYHWNPSEPPTTLLVVVDQTVDRNSTAPAARDGQLPQTGSAARSSGMISPSASPISAYDAVVTISNEGSVVPFLKQRYCSYNELITANFSPASLQPSVKNISILLSVISSMLQTTTCTAQCFWYASTIWEATTRLFPGCRETIHNDGRSTYLGLKVGVTGVQCKAKQEREAEEAVRQQLRLEVWLEVWMRAILRVVTKLGLRLRRELTH
ncbi:hypothetical protein BDR07DRAFT_964355 [Suillus spraguei]|nr:hypothetical protein BDR07DRAFT_964355 [Suillus spraguei]